MTHTMSINSSLSLLRPKPHDPQPGFAIDYEAMRRRCLMPVEEFKTEPGAQVVTIGETLYCFIDNGADVLAVAHLDTVQPPVHFERLVLSHRDLVFSPTLDDRLGVYVILDMLPGLIGRSYDILLATDEEQGNSSAKYFTTKKKYNWMFEFDRRGDDVALYQYEYSEAAKLLSDRYKLPVRRGSYTDICELQHLGCFGMNVGVGYDNAHSLDAYANMDVLTRMVSGFIRFFNDNHAMHFPFVTEPPGKTEQREQFILDDPWTDIQTPPGKQKDIYSNYFCRYCGSFIELPEQFMDEHQVDEFGYCYYEGVCPECLYSDQYN
jgi:hypothetical protein